MFSVKTSDIMKNLKPGVGGAAAAATDSNNKEFARFAAKAKVSPELVKAAFTNRGLNLADGSFAFSTKDMEKLKAYVASKLENRDLKPEDQARLLKVGGALLHSVQVRMNAAAAQAFPGTKTPRQKPVARQSAAPAPLEPTQVEGSVRRTLDTPLKRILVRVIEADKARATMQSATEHRSCIRAKLEAQRLYRQTSRELAKYIHEAPAGSPNKKAALEHQKRVLANVDAVKNFVPPPRV